MSTKIYDGFMFNCSSFYDVATCCANIQKELEPIAKEEYRKVYGRAIQEMAMYIHSNQLFCFADIEPLKYDGKNFADLRYFVNSSLRGNMAKNTTAKTIIDYCSDVDFDVNIWIFPLNKNKVLGVANISNSALRKAFFERPEILDYAYWNNTEAPENMSLRDWNQRKKDWDITLPGIGILSKTGFKRQLVDSTYLTSSFKLEDIKDLFSEKNDREMANRAAKYKLTDDYMEANKKEKVDVALWRDGCEYVRTHPEELQAIEEKFKLNTFDFLQNYQ